MLYDLSIAQLSKDLSESISAIETQRSKAEQWASILKGFEKKLQLHMRGL